MPRGSEKARGKSHTSEMMVVVVAQNLYDETLRLLCKEELFPKKSRWLMAQEVAQTANRFLDCGKLNAIRHAELPKIITPRSNVT